MLSYLNKDVIIIIIDQGQPRIIIWINLVVLE